MKLKEIYMEYFTIDEIILLINTYATMINEIGPDSDFICKLDNLMDALEEKLELEKTTEIKYGF